MGFLVENYFVRKAKTHEEWRTEYMTLLMRDKQKYNEGLSEGISIGREEGINEGQDFLFSAINAVRKGATEDDLRRQGFSDKTIQYALEALAIK